MPKRKNNKTLIIGISVFVLIIVGLGLTYYFLSPTEQAVMTVSPTSGCQAVGSMGSTTTGNYLCTSSECIVQGQVTLTQSATKDVWERSGTKCSQGFPTEAECRAQISMCNMIGSDGKCTTGSGICSSQTCTKFSSAIYGGTYNFCPSGVSNFPYCSGTTNTIAQSYSPGRTYYTDEYKLVSGQSVSFYPKNTDGSAVTGANQLITFKNYDCSCMPAVASGTACDSSSTRYYCKPVAVANKMFCATSRTSTAIQLASSSCKTYCGKDCTFDNYESDCSNSYPGYYCAGGTSLNTYQICDGKQKITNSICGAWNSTRTCSGAAVCVVDTTGTTGTGVGSCKCIGGVCSENQVRTGGSGDRSYQKCSSDGLGCFNWGSDIFCAEGSVYDSTDITLPPCKCSTVDSCNPGQSRCLSDGTIQRCKEKAVADVTGGKCYFWDTGTACPGEQKCDTGGTTAYDDYCSCQAVDKCQPNKDIYTNGLYQCISATTYKLCSKTAGNDYSCYNYDHSAVYTVPSLQQCKDGKLVERTDVGCAYPDTVYYSQFKCAEDSVKDVRGIIIESCNTANNACEIVQDEYTATLEEYNLGTLICDVDQKTILKAVKYEGLRDTAYRFEPKEVCEGENVCVEHSNAVCAPTYSYVGIIGNNTYLVNQELDEFVVDVTSNVGSNVGLTVTAKLLENGKSVTGTQYEKTNNQGKAYIDFGYASPRTGELVMTVEVKNAAGVSYTQSKTIIIKKALDLKLTCPLQGYMNRDITCEWTVKDAETKLLVTGIVSSPSVKQGTTELDYINVGLAGLKFQSSKLGLVDVTVSASKDGYANTEATTQVSIVATEITTAFKLDSEDIATAGNLKIGSHDLTIDVEESGVDLTVDYIEATMRTPSGQEVPLTFSKVNGVYKTTYNFQQAGQTYNVDGVIYYADGKDPTPFEYKITTLSTTTDTATQSTTNYLIIGGITAFVVILGLVLFIIFRKKKR